MRRLILICAAAALFCANLARVDAGPVQSPGANDQKKQVIRWQAAANTTGKTGDANAMRGQEPHSQTLKEKGTADANTMKGQEPRTHVPKDRGTGDGDTIQGQRPRSGALKNEGGVHITTASSANNQNPIGHWRSVDFVKEMADFKPGKKSWKGGLFLKGLRFYGGGKTSGPWTWNNGILWHPGDRTESKYLIETIDGSNYLFMEWMSGDVIHRGQKPWYYVLKKT